VGIATSVETVLGGLVEDLIVHELIVRLELDCLTLVRIRNGLEGAADLAESFTCEVLGVEVVEVALLVGVADPGVVLLAEEVVGLLERRQVRTFGWRLIHF